MATGTIIILYMIAAVAMIGLVKLLVHLSTSADLAVTRTDLLTPTPAELLRALVIHAQWLYIISMMVGVPWPPSLQWPLQVVGGIWSSTSGSSIGFECILKGNKAAPVAIQKLLICLFTPAGVLCGVLMIEAAMHYLRPARSKHAGHDFASVVMCIVFMFLPTWVNTTLSLFTCVGLDNPVDPPYQALAVGSWWVEDMSQLCYSRSGYHRGWALGLGIPLTLLFCVALPAGVFVFMWYSRKQGKLTDMDFQRHYGFVYRLWKDDWCWWESVALLQTIALVIVSTFGFALGGFHQCLLSSTVLAIVGILLLAVKPFKCPAAGRVAVLSVCVLFFTTQAALSFIPSTNIHPGPVYGNIMGAVILVANVVFLVRTAWQLVKVVDWAAVMQALRKLACCRRPGGDAGMPPPHGPPKEKDPAVAPNTC
jgi:hypothetical protein